MDTRDLCMLENLVMCIDITVTLTTSHYLCGVSKCVDGKPCNECALWNRSNLAQHVYTLEQFLKENCLQITETL